MATASIAPYETLCSSDFLDEWFDLHEYQGALVVYPTLGSNPGLHPIRYPLSVRVYTLSADGSYGLNESAIAMVDVEGTMSDVYFATGLRHYGDFSGSGFRTSVGFYNHTKAPQRIRIYVYDEGGEEVWEYDQEVEANQQVQRLLPQSIDFIRGFAVFINDGHEIHGTGDIYPYATVTDNESGDGRFIHGAKYWVEEGP